MKTISLLVPAAAALLAASPVTAAFDPSIVAADARWVVHADFNDLRDSALGKELIAAASGVQHQATQGMLSVDVPKLLETIGAATAYGTNFAKDPHALDGTLVLRGAPELRTILEGFLVQSTVAEPAHVAEITDLPFPAYSISDPNHPNGGLVVAFPPEPIVLASKSKAQLAKARDVVRGTAPSLARASDSPLRGLLRPARDAYLFCATAVPSDEVFAAHDGPHARILKMAHSLSLALGETDATTFAHAQLVAPDEAMADKLMKILQGMTAMLSLAETSDRHLADFLNATKVTRDDETVTLHLAYDSARLVDMVKALHTTGTRMHGSQGRRGPQITSGRVLGEWQAEDVGDAPSAPATRTIENVTLQNGSTISLGRALNGGRAAGFTKVEIVPAGGGAALTFSREMMQQRGQRLQFQFPGADGTYTLNVVYVNDGSGKTTYAVSVRHPKDNADN